MSKQRRSRSARVIARLAHPEPDARLDDGRSPRERGYILALTALMILPILAFTSYAVDLGAWYARAAKIQAATDAASLAGAAQMPDFDTARAKAIEVATANGFTNGVDGITVNVTQVPNDPSKIKVNILDASVEQFFSGAFRDDVDITRQATAELIRPVPMGSPRNYIGTNTQQSSQWRENFSTAASGYCVSKEQGERRTAFSDWNYSSTSNGSGSFQNCTPPTSGTIANDDYSSDGYFYVVEIPKTAPSSNLTIQVQGAAHCPGISAEGSSNGADTPTNANSSDQRDAYQWTVREGDTADPAAGTPVGGPGNTPGPTTITSSTSVSGTNNYYCGATNSTNRWRTFYTGSVDPGDIFYVQVDPVVPSDKTETTGSNQFAIRAYTSGSFSPCTGDNADTAYNPNCPNVYALTHLGVYANIGGSNAVFYLANVGTQYENHTMELYLWDAGEGAQTIELIQPNGNPATFKYEVACKDGTFTSETGTSCTGETAPSGGYGPFNNVNILNVSGSYCANRPSTRTISCSKYNDRLVRLTVALPADFAAAYGSANGKPRTWWKVRYVSGSSPTDRTTWSVVIKGDPVRLVPEV